MTITYQRVGTMQNHMNRSRGRTFCKWFPAFYCLEVNGTELFRDEIDDNHAINSIQGKYYQLSLADMHRKIKEEYGAIAKMPGMLGNPEIVVVFDSANIEKVFRNEGIWPYRIGIKTFDHYRKDIRPDVFKNLGGLLSEQGEPWAKMRSIVSPIMLKPALVNAYVPIVDEIAIEFCDRMKTLRDDKLGNVLSYSMITVPNRLGVIGLHPNRL